MHLIEGAERRDEDSVINKKREANGAFRLAAGGESAADEHIHCVGII